MDSIWESYASSTPPSIPGNFQTGFPSETGPVTIPGAYWYHMITQEVRNAILALGGNPDPLSTNQLGSLLTSCILEQYQKSLGFIPVQQGTGVGQLQNNIKIGWSGSDIRATVDANDLGAFVLEKSLSGQVGYFAMTTPPSGWLKANGAAVSRTAYRNLFNAITLQTTGATTSGSATISSVASTAGMAVGMPISGPGIPAGATLTYVTGSSLTISANATASASGVAIVVAPFGVGDGSTTFNLPDMRGEFMRGFDDGRGVDSARIFGSFQYDQFASHTHQFTRSKNAASGTSSETPTSPGVGISSQETTATGGTETRPRNIALLACIKY